MEGGGGEKEKEKGKEEEIVGRKTKLKGQIPFLVQLLRRDVGWPLLCGRQRNGEKVLSRKRRAHTKKKKTTGATE